MEKCGHCGSTNVELVNPGLELFLWRKVTPSVNSEKVYCKDCGQLSNPSDEYLSDPDRLFKVMPIFSRHKKINLSKDYRRWDGIQS